MAVEVDSPQGGWDATGVNPIFQGIPIAKTRQAVSLADPYVTDARLRFAFVDGVYRIPTSNPAISDAVIAMDTSVNARLLMISNEQTELMKLMLLEMRTMNLHLAEVTEEMFDPRDIEEGFVL